MRGIIHDYDRGNIIQYCAGGRVATTAANSSASAERAHTQAAGYRSSAGGTPQTKAIITVEEHSVIGGLGSAVAEVLAEMGGDLPLFKRHSVGDSFLQVIGDQEYLRQACGLSTEAICKAVEAILEPIVNIKG